MYWGTELSEEWICVNRTKACSHEDQWGKNQKGITIKHFFFKTKYKSLHPVFNGSHLPGITQGGVSEYWSPDDSPTRKKLDLPTAS